MMPRPGQPLIDPVADLAPGRGAAHDPADRQLTGELGGPLPRSVVVEDQPGQHPAVPGLLAEGPDQTLRTSWARPLSPGGSVASHGRSHSAFACRTRSQAARSR